MNAALSDMKRLILLAVWFGLLAADGDRYQVERERMVHDQIEARGIKRSCCEAFVPLRATSSFLSYFAHKRIRIAP